MFKKFKELKRLAALSAAQALSKATAIKAPENFDVVDGVSRFLRRPYLTKSLTTFMNSTPSAAKEKERRFGPKAPRLTGLKLGDLPALNLNALRVDFMPWHNHSLAAFVSCGTNILSQLTGTNPLDVEAWAKEESKKSQTPSLPSESTGMLELSIEVMAAFLAQFQINTYEVTVADICGTAASHIEQTLTEQHVILTETQWTPTKTSWVVVHKGRIYHDIATYKLTGLFFLNRPVLRQFVLFSPLWEYNGKLTNSMDYSAD